MSGCRTETSGRPANSAAWRNCGRPGDASWLSAVSRLDRPGSWASRRVFFIKPCAVNRRLISANSAQFMPLRLDLVKQVIHGRIAQAIGELCAVRAQHLRPGDQTFHAFQGEFPPCLALLTAGFLVGERRLVHDIQSLACAAAAVYSMPRRPVLVQNILGQEVT